MDLQKYRTITTGLGAQYYTIRPIKFNTEHGFFEWVNGFQHQFSNIDFLVSRKKISPDFEVFFYPGQN